MDLKHDLTTPLTPNNIFVAWLPCPERAGWIGGHDICTQWMFLDPTRAWQHAQATNPHILSVISLANLRILVSQLPPSDAWWRLSYVHAIQTEEGLQWTLKACRRDIVMTGKAGTMKALLVDGEEIFEELGEGMVMTG